MAEEIDRGSSDRQATWVALRTLRQRPAVVGRTDDGATVYEIRSVRLVLTPGTSHFRRLVPCAKCGREVPGSSILSVFDLDRPANSVFCDRCAQSSHAPRPEIRRPREDPPAVPRPVAQPVVTKGVVEPGRLAPGESRAEGLSRAPAPAENVGELQRLSKQVADVLRGQNAELAKLSALVAEAGAEMRELGESNRALAGVQQELDRRMVDLAAQVEAHHRPEIETALARELVDVRASLAAMIDATAQPLHAAIADGLDHLRSEIASLQRRVDESAGRSEMEQIAEASRQLAGVQGDLDEKLRQLAARPEPDPDAVGARELAEVRASVIAMIDTERIERRAALAEGLDILQAEIAGIEPRIGGELAGITARLELQRTELTQALHDVAQETLMSVAEPLRDLTIAREDFERRLDSLQQKAEEGERRLEALTASADARASRQDALEQLIESTTKQLARLIEFQTQTAPAPVGRPVPGGIMEALERQLRAAELRLLRTTSDAGGD